METNFFSFSKSPQKVGRLFEKEKNAG